MEKGEIIEKDNRKVKGRIQFCLSNEVFFTQSFLNTFEFTIKFIICFKVLKQTEVFIP